MWLEFHSIILPRGKVQLFSKHFIFVSKQSRCTALQMRFSPWPVVQRFVLRDKTSEETPSRTRYIDGDGGNRPFEFKSPLSQTKSAFYVTQWFFFFFFFLPHLKLRIYLGTVQRATKAISLNWLSQSTLTKAGIWTTYPAFFVQSLPCHPAAKNRSANNRCLRCLTGDHSAALTSCLVFCFFNLVVIFFSRAVRRFYG